MDQESLDQSSYGISDDDWQRTPSSVKRLIRDLERRVTTLEEANRLLQEQLATNSSNSSHPPSSDPPQTTTLRRRKKRSGRKRGAQPGHTGHTRKLLPVEQCQRVVEHYRPQCRNGGGQLTGEDDQPLRHQVIEVPPVAPHVEEHRLHRLTCQSCGTLTRAMLPSDVPPTGYGPRVVALVAVLSGLYRTSERLTQSALADLFGVEISLGSVNALR